MCDADKVVIVTNGSLGSFSPSGSLEKQYKIYSAYTWLLSPNLIIGDVTLKQPVTLLGQAQGYQDGKAKNHLFKPNPFIFLKHKWDQRITELSNHEKGSNPSSETTTPIAFS